MHNKDNLIFGAIFCWWVCLVGAFLTLTWPPSTFVILFWFACGFLVAGIYVLDEVMSRRPLDGLIYLNLIWFLLGVVSLLVFLLNGWYKYRTSNLYLGKTLR